MGAVILKMWLAPWTQLLGPEGRPTLATVLERLSETQWGETPAVREQNEVSTERSKDKKCCGHI